MPKLGAYTLHVIEAGRFALDGGAMFGIIPRVLWEKRITPDAKHRIPLNMRCLLLESADRLILIDNGLGTKYDTKFARIYGIDTEHPTLEKSLKAKGFGMDEVTDVILTHLHFDHAGGSTYRKGDALKITFPNATFHVQRDHWVWARMPNQREQASFMAENLDPLAASGQLNFLDGPGTLFPGIDVRTVFGHTEAQQIVLLHGEETTLAYVADLIPTSVHLAPVWGMGYDVRPLVTIEEKTAFLEEAFEHGWQLFFEHDPTWAVTSLTRTDRGYIDATNLRSLDELR